MLQQFNRHGRGRAEIIIGQTHIEMKFAGVVPVADIAVEAADGRSREITKPAIVQALEGAVDGKIIHLLAPLGRALDAAKRTAHGVDLGAMIVEAILHLHVDRPAQRIETEGRIVGHHGDGAYRGGWDQIPVDGVAERLVDANPVLVDRQPLRRSGHGRCDEAAKLHVRLKRIAGDLVDNDARHLLLQRIGDIQRTGARNLIGVDDVDACRNFVGIDAGARDGRGRIHHEPRHGGSHGPSRIFRPPGLRAWRG